MYNGTQFPMLASGLAIIYNLPGANHTLIMNGYQQVYDIALVVYGRHDPSLTLPGMLGRTVLASIWFGNITTWDHPAIKELNPAMDAAGELPHQNITLAFDLFGVLDLTGVRKLGAISFVLP